MARQTPEIAAEVGVHVDTVRKWRRRFVAGGLPGLDDLPRSGRRSDEA
ncbi:MAG: helix-turn-helix domain-containing protein [Mycobacterium sp.]